MILRAAIVMLVVGGYTIGTGIQELAGNQTLPGIAYMALGSILIAYALLRFGFFIHAWITHGYPKRRNISKADFFKLAAIGVVGWLSTGLFVGLSEYASWGLEVPIALAWISSILIAADFLQDSSRQSAD